MEGLTLGYHLLVLVLGMGFLWVVTDNLRFSRQMGQRRSRIRKSPPLVSVLIPARNEAHNLPACLASVLAQSYPNLELWVYDDHSEDQTREVVQAWARRDPRVHLLPGRPLPQGWMGKNFACAQLARHARGRYWLFLDADTRMAPDTLAWAVSLMESHRADLLSLIPTVETRSLAEALTQTLITTAFLGFFPLRWIWQRRSTLWAAALGPWIMVRASAYRETGGHAALRWEVVEDIALARLFKARGKRVLVLAAPERVRVRFYEGLRQTWYGFGKSAFGAFQYSVRSVLLLFAAVLMVFYLPVVGLVRSLWIGQGPWPLYLAESLLLPLVKWRADRPYGYAAWQALLAHLSVLFGLLTVAYSMYQVLVHGGVWWKGRFYPVHPPEELQPGVQTGSEF